MSDASSSFGESAKNYAAFRPAYPPEVFSFLTDHLDGRSHAVDLGAGSGQATRALAALFERVTAVEPDARLAGETQPMDNVAIRIAAAEAVEFSAESIDAVISATAFHWMDQPTICRHAHSWLRPGGVFFPFAFDAFEVKGPANSFYAAEFAKWAAYRDQRLVDCYDYTAALEESGLYARVIPYAHRMRREIPAQIAAGIVSTFSFVRAYAREHGGDEYHKKLSETLSAFGDVIVFDIPIIGALGIKA